ncbi:hypothetical protein M153_4350006374 [Pseudoloma neurophilia]|uniref:Uncharacterized protein n=1 Tax=Pseudoloma neurophilia TaxID=146866 RepID=A0A0R0LXI0_9MICR|nr:hypothetical protein M153_4350006374 [Pseudoloma neurophilia]
MLLFLEENESIFQLRKKNMKRWIIISQQKRINYDKRIKNFI